jgi:RNA polymerase subunit RPABC4/transcription elongation factor Spt4
VIGRPREWASRCSMCDLNYPPEMNTCPICEQATTRYSGISVTEDWQQEVSRRTKTSLEIPDKIIAWRHKVFLDLGLDDMHAALLAYSKEVDLEKARSMAKAGCDPALIFDILA